jgi:hypothetical protein
MIWTINVYHNVETIANHKLLTEHYTDLRKEYKCIFSGVQHKSRTEHSWSVQRKYNAEVQASRTLDQYFSKLSKI